MPADRALLDTGVLVAFLHGGDEAHDAAVHVLRTQQGVLLTTEAVLTEAMHLLSRTVGGERACLDFFLRGGAHLVPSSRAALARCRTLLQEYGDLPADFAAATLVALAEDTDTWTVLTLDPRGFSTFRGSEGQHFEIRP